MDKIYKQHGVCNKRAKQNIKKRKSLNDVIKKCECEVKKPKKLKQTEIFQMLKVDKK